MEVGDGLGDGSTYLPVCGEKKIVGGGSLN